MRCKACDKEIEVNYWQPEDSPVVILEDLCPYCLYIVRASVYDGGPDNELDTIAQSLGVDHGAHSSE